MKKIILLLLVANGAWLAAFSQNVGIGTQTPEGKLHIKGSADTSQLTIDASASQTNTHPLVRFRDAAGQDLMHLSSDNRANVFLGYGTGMSNLPTGTSNTFIGTWAGAYNTEGKANSAFGYAALYANSTGNSNTAIGQNAMKFNSTGETNTAFGVFSLFSNIAGKGNNAVGYSTLYYSTGNNNTANGTYGLFSNKTGSGNTAIGAYADVTVDNLTNATAIGYGAKVDASNKIRLGSTLVTVIEGQVAYSFPSDARFKYNIKNNVPGLDFITRLKPVTYYFDTEKLAKYTETGILNKSNIHPVSFTGEKQLHTGFLAQDVEKLANELGYQFDGLHKPSNDRDHYSLAYSQFIMPLVKAVQEQQKMIDDLKKIVKMQQGEINNLKAKSK